MHIIAGKNHYFMDIFVREYGCRNGSLQSPYTLLTQKEILYLDKIF